MARYEQEKGLQALFVEFDEKFPKLAGMTDARKQEALLKELAAKLQDAKGLIREFEKEARTDGLSPLELSTRKKAYVVRLNEYIAQKMDWTNRLAEKKELLGASPRAKGRSEITEDQMTTQQLIARGHEQIKQTDAALLRSEKIVQDTIEIGTKTAETLHGQGKQMERVLDELEEIHFSMKKANQVIRDITRSMATDRCIQGMFMLVILGAVVVIILKSMGFGTFGSSPPPPPPPAAPATTSGRRLLLQEAWQPAAAAARQPPHAVAAERGHSLAPKGGPAWDVREHWQESLLRWWLVALEILNRLDYVA